MWDKDYDPIIKSGSIWDKHFTLTGNDDLDAMLAAGVIGAVWVVILSLFLYRP